MLERSFGPEIQGCARCGVKVKIIANIEKAKGKSRTPGAFRPWNGG